MNYRNLSDREVCNRAESVSLIPQDLAHELLWRLQRSGSKGTREGDIIPQTNWTAKFVYTLPLTIVSPPDVRP